MVRFEINRSISGMGIERDPSRDAAFGEKPTAELARVSSASTAADCATLSITLGMPSTLVPPFLGISTARTGPGKYDPDVMRFHSR